MEEVKKSKKKNKVASLLLALALILTCGVAGTIAQYQKSFGGTSTANIAKFDVTAGNLDAGVTKDLKLFDTVSDTKNNGTVGTDYTEKDVKQGTIAPGTQGCIDMSITNNSDVAISYDLKAKLENATVQLSDGKNYTLPLEFVITDSADYDENANWITLDGSHSIDGDGFETLADAATATNNQEIAMNTATPVARYLHWRWAYTDSANEKARNELDTKLGENADSINALSSKTKLTIKLVVKQKD